MTASPARKVRPEDGIVRQWSDVRQQDVTVGQVYRRRHTYELVMAGRVVAGIFLTWDEAVAAAEKWEPEDDEAAYVLNGILDPRTVLDAR